MVLTMDVSHRCDRRRIAAVRPLLAVALTGGSLQCLAWVGLPSSVRPTARPGDVARKQRQQTNIDVEFFTKYGSVQEGEDIVADVSPNWKHSFHDRAFRAADLTAFLPKIEEMVVDVDLTEKRKYLDLVRDLSFRAKKWKRMVQASPLQMKQTARDQPFEVKWKHSVNEPVFRAADRTAFLPNLKDMVIDDDLTEKRKYLNLVQDPVFIVNKWKQMVKAVSRKDQEIEVQWKQSANDQLFKAAVLTAFSPEFKDMVIDDDLTEKRRYLDLVADPVFIAKKWQSLIQAASMPVDDELVNQKHEAKWKHSVNDPVFKAADLTTFLPSLKEMAIDDDLTEKRRYLNLVHDPVFTETKWKSMLQAFSTQERH